MQCLNSCLIWAQRQALACGLACLPLICAIIGCGEGKVPTEVAETTTQKQGDKSSSVPANSGAMPIPKTQQPTPAPMPKPTPEKPADKPLNKAAEPEINWGALISAEDLQDEVQRIRLRLTENLSSIGKYNAHYNKEIRWDGSSLAALAAIAVVHPDNVGWKIQAAHIRDLSSKMVTATAGGLGQKPYAATRKEFDDVTRLLEGAPVVDLPAAIQKVSFRAIAKRQGLMHALEEGTDYLKANFQNPGPFQTAGKEIARKALVMATYCAILSTKGYPGANDPEYQGFLSLLKDANLTMAKAARNQDFATFTNAKEKTTKYCAGCHASYAGGSE